MCGRERFCWTTTFQMLCVLRDVLFVQVKVDNEESDESYESSWSYMQDIQVNSLVGHDRRTFHKELKETTVATKITCIQKDFSLHSYSILILSQRQTESQAPHSEEQSGVGPVPKFGPSVSAPGRRILEGLNLASVHIQLRCLPTTFADVRHALSR